MEKDLSNYRKNYQKGELRLHATPETPFELFRDWFMEVEEHFNPGEVNAMTISTVGLDGYPKSRVVLLKRYNDEGFVFFTNYHSEKGRAIENEPRVCASFFWEQSERQVIVKGRAERIAENLSDDYFQSRPKGSQLGAMASDQSSVVDSRQVLENRLKSLENAYKDKSIERPKNWGGYIIKPVEIEFWQGRPNRLHDRICCYLNGIDWKAKRLAP